ncbi:GNAT family N-acetyltransferase [Thalassotalea litorea]|uniref:GNAT family N-acetyltransferase n=1 Tax=Thalassotalea litorea TaxID=2020715 RepID=UPI001FE8ADA9|nr:GNAT family N-acetyltransferase [Thalassotalea litorea]
MSDPVVFEADTKFAVFARNDQGKLQGGIRANAFWNYCVIELLWLSTETRGTGIGTKLMLAAEQFAASNGFEYVRTETLDFQAKHFYQKLGYHVYGQLSDLPKGHTTYCLVKKL